MKIRSRYPALVSGRLRRMTSDKLVLCMPEDDFEVREAKSADAPLALIVTQHGTTTEFRLHEGVLYTAIPATPEKIVEDTQHNPMAARFKAGHPVFGTIAEELHEIARTKDANETRPERLYSLLSARVLPTDVTERATVNAGQIDETESSTYSLEFWREKARKRFAEILRIDGKQWQKAPEPAYKLNLFTCTAEAHLSDVYDEGMKDGRWREFDWEDMGNRYFSAVDVEAMTETAFKLRREGRDRFELRGNIEVILPEALRLDYADLELDRAARVCVRKIEGELNRIARSEAKDLKSFPRQVFIEACHLRDALAYRTPYDKADDSLAAALEKFVDALDRHPELVAEMRFAEEVPSLRDILDIWSSRDTIAIPGLVAARSM